MIFCSKGEVAVSYTHLRNLFYMEMFVHIVNTIYWDLCNVSKLFLCLHVDRLTYGILYFRMLLSSSFWRPDRSLSPQMDELPRLIPTTHFFTLTTEFVYDDIVVNCFTVSDSLSDCIMRRASRFSLAIEEWSRVFTSFSFEKALSQLLE